MLLGFDFSRDPIVVLLELAGDFYKVLIRSIEKVAVVKDLHNICVELSRSVVAASLELVFNGGEIHRLLHYLKILGNVESLHVNWLHKGQCTFMLLQLLQNL